LYEHRIEAVVDLAYEERPADLPREFVVLRYPLTDDGANNPVLLIAAVNSVAELIRGGIPVLVCCGAGMSRSPAVAATALSVAFGTSREECLRKLAEIGPADVSPGLWSALGMCGRSGTD
jgi:protein-tyrosine phosphatase